MLRHPRETAKPASAFGGLDLLLDGLKVSGSNLGERTPFYRTIIESLSEGFLIADTEGRIVDANERLGEITGYPQHELIGKTGCQLLLLKEGWPAMEKRLKTQASDQPEDYEREMLRKDGRRRWVQVRFRPLLNSQGKMIGILGAVNCLQQRKMLERENEHWRDELRAELNPGTIVGQNQAMKKVLEQIKVVASTGASVLIVGEAGTGKDLVARAIHDLSDRRVRPLVRVHCQSLARELFESEFFGHARAGLSGAIGARVGHLELAEGGTLFLDEIGAIPLAFQSRLLSVLRQGKLEKSDEDHPRAVTARFIATTSRDLVAEARAGRFRIDLFHRLSVFPIALPPLRERREDIGPLAEHFLEQLAKRSGLPAPGLTKAQVRELEDHDWPGNVRELKNLIERAVILWRSTGALQVDPGTSRAAGAGGRTAENPARDSELSLRGLKVRERDILLRALEQTRWKIYGTDGAAALLDLRPTTLSSKMKKFGLTNLQAGRSQVRRTIRRSWVKGASAATAGPKLLPAEGLPASPFAPERGRPSIEMAPALDLTTCD